MPPGLLRKLLIMFLRNAWDVERLYIIKDLYVALIVLIVKTPNAY